LPISKDLNITLSKVGSMGVILGSKIKDDGKVIVELALDYEEAIQLRGHMEDVHVFSEKVADIMTKIAQRGKNEATKYFLIPKELRKNLKLGSSVSCQKIDMKTKAIFVYVVDKIMA